MKGMYAGIFVSSFTVPSPNIECPMFRHVHVDPPAPDGPLLPRPPARAARGLVGDGGGHQEGAGHRRQGRGPGGSQAQAAQEVG